MRTDGPSNSPSSSSTQSSSSTGSDNRTEAPADRAGGSDGATTHSASTPRRVADAAANASDHRERANATANGTDRQSQQTSLEHAAINTQAKVGEAAVANRALESLQQLAPARRNAMNAEVNVARQDAMTARSVAQTAVADELDIARNALSPAHFDRYVEGLERDVAREGVELRVRDSQRDVTVDVQAIAQPEPANPALAAIQDQAESVEAAEMRYATALEESRNLPPRMQPLTTAAPKADLDHQRTELASMIRADLAAAPAEVHAHPYASPVEDRARAIAALDPANQTLQTTVAETEQQVVIERTTTPAVESINRTFAEKGAVAAAEALAVQTAGMTPEQGTRLVERLDGTIDQITADLGSAQYDENVMNAGITSLARAAESAGPSATQQIAESLAAGFDDAGVHMYDGPFGNEVKRYKLDDAFHAAIGTGVGANLAVATSDALHTAGRIEAAGKIDAAIVSGVEDLTADFTATQEAYASLEVELNTSLAELDPAFQTPEQRAAYIEAFWADTTRPTDEVHLGDLSHAEIKAKFESVDAELSATLAATAPRMEEMVRGDDWGAGKVLLEGYEALARTPAHAEESIAWMSRVKGDAELFGKIDVAIDPIFRDGLFSTRLSSRFEEHIASYGVQSMASQLLADMAAASTPAEKETLYSQFKETVGTIGLAQTTLDTINDVFTKTDEIRRDLGRLSGVVPHGAEYNRLVGEIESNSVGLIDIFGGDSKFGKAMAVTGVAIGFADAYLAFEDGKLPEGINDALSASAGAAQLGVDLLGVMGKAGKVSSEFADGAGRFVAKSMPLISFYVDLVDLSQDLKELKTNPNIGEAIAGIGTLFNLASDVPELEPGAGTAAGAVIGGVGSILRGVGGVIDDVIEGDEAAEALHAREKKYLMEAGIDEKTAENLIAHVDEIALYDNFGMSPEAVRSFINREAKLDNDQSDLTRVARETAAAFGYTGERAEQFFESVYNSPNAQQIMDGPNRVYDTVFRDNQFWNEAIGGDRRGELMRDIRTSQAEWFKQNMPDVYE